MGNAGRGAGRDEAGDAVNEQIAEVREEERWMPIPGFPKHEISDLGRVRSWCWAAARNSRPRILKLLSGRYGYLYVTLKQKGGRSVSFRINRLVLQAFGPPCPSPKHHAAHNNGDNLDNRISNLRWATATENAADRIAHGTHRRGEAMPNAKFTEAMIREIRCRYSGGETAKSLAGTFGFSVSVIKEVVRRKRWRHVQ